MWYKLAALVAGFAVICVLLPIQSPKVYAQYGRSHYITFQHPTKGKWYYISVVIGLVIMALAAVVIACCCRSKSLRSRPVHVIKEARPANRPKPAQQPYRTSTPPYSIDNQQCPHQKDTKMYDVQASAFAVTVGQVIQETASSDGCATTTTRL